METIYLYTLEEAEKIIIMKRKKKLRRKARQLKQKLIFKGISILCIVTGIAVASIVDFDNGGCLAVCAIGLFGLLVPYNAEITF